MVKIAFACSGLAMFGLVAVLVTILSRSCSPAHSISSSAWGWWTPIWAHAFLLVTDFHPPFSLRWRT